jgi:hypothetical protein
MATSFALALVFALLAALFAFALDDPGDARDFADALFALAGMGHGNRDRGRLAEATALHVAAVTAAAATRIATSAGRRRHVLARGCVVVAGELDLLEAHDRLVDLFQFVLAAAFAAFFGGRDVFRDEG